MMGIKTILKRVSHILPDKLYLQLKFFMRMGKWPDLKNPRTFNEKLQWLKLYDRRPEYTMMVDKYRVKEYVAGIIGAEHIIPTLGVWDSFDEIDFDALPEQFVLKCTHDSGGLVICKDKGGLDKEAAKKKIEKSLKRNYFWPSREWAYKDVKPRIIAEQYLYDNDFPDRAVDNIKLFCMDGECPLFYITIGGGHNPNMTLTCFDGNKKRLPLRHQGYPTEKGELAVLSEIDRMFQLANQISKGIPFLRVDFYLVNSHIYVGELTFYPNAGYNFFDPPEYDMILGDQIILPLK